MSIPWRKLTEAAIASGFVAAALWATSSWLFVIATGAHKEPLTGTENIILFPIVSSFLGLPFAVLMLVLGRVLAVQYIPRLAVVVLAAALGSALQAAIMGPGIAWMAQGALVGAISGWALLIFLRPKVAEPRPSEQQVK